MTPATPTCGSLKGNARQRGSALASNFQARDWPEVSYPDNGSKSWVARGGRQRRLDWTKLRTSGRWRRNRPRAHDYDDCGSARPACPRHRASLHRRGSGRGAGARGVCRLLDAMRCLPAGRGAARHRPAGRRTGARTARGASPSSRSRAASPISAPMPSGRTIAAIATGSISRVGSDFPLDALPASTGVIVADRFGAEIRREAPLQPMAAGSAPQAGDPLRPHRRQPPPLLPRGAGLSRSLPRRRGPC